MILMNGCLPLLKKCGFNYDGTAIDYLCTCVANSDSRCEEATSREQNLDKEWEKITRKLNVGLTKEQQGFVDNELFELAGSNFNLGYEQGFAKAFKLGLKLGAEVFTDEDSKDYRDINQE
jgi:hypothetical protein